MGKKKQKPTLLAQENPVAQRQPKTDRLFLARFAKAAAEDNRLEQEPWQEAHQILIKWADMEASGRLATQKEKNLQGKFLEDVFSAALGYAWATENTDVWHLEQEHNLAGQTPDGVLGFFRQNQPQKPLAVIELKGPKVHLDRDRSNGRTAVDQLWDYLVNTSPECRWGIASNMVSFRLYERESTKRRYEHFTLQSLRSEQEFRRFYAIFRRAGLIEKTAREEPRAIQLLKQTSNRQREAGDALYEAYSKHRLNFVEHLHSEQELPLETAIEYAQRLLDRVIFIAFCEDRGLLPTHTLKRAYDELPGFSQITNPRWQNFKTLFRFVDQGGRVDPNKPNGEIPAYNGGLFAETGADELELDDEWTHFFHTISTFDFADEVNLDVLGHLFERSITELEKLKSTGVYGDAEKAEQYGAMPQSAKRKRLGIYYTPPELTSRIVQYTVDELIEERFTQLAVEHGTPAEDARRGAAPETGAYWQACLDVLRNLKVVDPACGSGAFLFQAYNALEQRYLEVLTHLGDDEETLAAQVPQWILQQNLYGVDLSPEAVEITQLALWIRSAARGQTLAKLSENIVHGNSLVHDPEVHPDAFDWRERFPEVFNRDEPGFDCVIGNPPWERMDLSEREFFSFSAPEIATATTGAKRKALVEALVITDAVLYERYDQTKQTVDSQREYCRNSGRYPLTGKGRTNLYAVFAELADSLVASKGRVGLLTPSGIASDKTTKDFFAAITETDRLIRLYDFENKKIYFPEVHAAFKFCIINYGGVDIRTRAADYCFFIHQIEELADRQ